jgi:hypothetical protein
MEKESFNDLHEQLNRKRNRVIVNKKSGTHFKRPKIQTNSSFSEYILDFHSGKKLGMTTTHIKISIKKDESMELAEIESCNNERTKLITSRSPFNVEIIIKYLVTGFSIIVIAYGLIYCIQNTGLTNIRDLGVFLLIKLVLYKWYCKCKENQQIQKIFTEIKHKLYDLNQSNIESWKFGIKEDDIIEEYSKLFAIDEKYFKRNFLPVLKKMRKEDSCLKEFEIFNHGIRKIAWQWTDRN